MSAFRTAQLAAIRPEERILQCGAPRRKHKRNGYRSRVVCEKPALHGFGCLLSAAQREAAEGSEAAYSLVRVIQHEALRHAGRDGQGKWYFWIEEG